jgi:hypothetical protein
VTTVLGFTTVCRLAASCVFRPSFAEGATRFEFEPPCLARFPSLAMSSDNEILAIEDKRYAAMCSGDFGALEAMLHSELLYTHSSGLPTPSGHGLRPCAREGEYKSAACGDRKVRLAGDTVFVTGRAAIEAEINGQPRSLRLVFLNA